MEAFEALRNNTLCPFAAASRIDYAPDWDRAATFGENVVTIADSLRSHLPRCREERLQGFVAQIGITDPSFEGAVSAFRRLLLALGQHDSSCHEALQGDIGGVDWNFVFDAQPIFLNLFANCYPTPHSKWIGDPDHAYVFFQPQFTFDFCNLNRMRTGVKHSIRTKFSQAGMPYDGDAIDGRRKAITFVFPLESSQRPVEWWLYP